MYQANRIQIKELNVNFYIYANVKNEKFVEYTEIFNSNILSGNLHDLFESKEHLRCPNFPSLLPSYCNLHNFLYALAGDSNKSDQIAKTIVDLVTI